MNWLIEFLEWLFGIKFSATMIKLTKIPLPESSYKHVFQRADGSLFSVPTTRENYRQLGTENPVNPAHSDGKWIYSWEFYDIPLNCYADEKGLQELVNYEGKIGILPLGGIKNNELSANQVAEINQQLN